MVPKSFECQCGTAAGVIKRGSSGESLLVVETEEWIFEIEWAKVTHKVDGASRFFYPNQASYDTLMDHYKK